MVLSKTKLFSKKETHFVRAGFPKLLYGIRGIIIKKAPLPLQTDLLNEGELSYKPPGVLKLVTPLS